MSTKRVRHHLNIPPSLFHQAVELHYAWCEENGYLPDQPCFADSEYLMYEDGSAIILLKNVYGIMSAYEVLSDEELERLELEDLGLSDEEDEED